MSISTNGKLREGTLGALGAVANGATIGISDLKDVDVVVTGTVVGTWILQISHDAGTTWSTFDTGTAVKHLAALPRCGAMRLICSAWTSGSIVGFFGGEDINR